MDPRVSFSIDFVDVQQAMKMKREATYREAPVSSDFEFCVKNNAMISADEVFSQGKLVLHNNNKSKKLTTTSTTTLRDELLVSDDLYDDVLPRVPKSLSRWKERLGLRKNGSNKKKVAEEDRPNKDSNLVMYFFYIYIHPSFS